MPYKDHEKQKIAKSEHYQKNKAAYRARLYQRRIDIAKWLWDLRSKAVCADCGEKDTCCLDYHHIDPNTKELTICGMALAGYKKERILAEIAKCIVLCANCHRRRHYMSGNRRHSKF